MESKSEDTAETRDEVARSLLPGLLFLAREAHDAGLADVASIIANALNGVSEWIETNDNQEGGGGGNDRLSVGDVRRRIQ